MTAQIEFPDPCSRCGKAVPWGKGCGCSTGKMEVDRLLVDIEKHRQEVQAMVDEIHSGPPWAGTCLNCLKRTVTFKSGGAPDGYELSCDACGALYDED